MADTRIRWDKPALHRVVGDGSEPIIRQLVDQATSKANALSAGNRTGIWHDPKTRERKGDTEPSYMGDVQRRKTYPVGSVWTGNYAAAKDNMNNNTLLKAVPHV